MCHSSSAHGTVCHSGSVTTVKSGERQRLALLAAPAGLAGAACAVVLWMGPRGSDAPPGLCPFRAATGLDCPGCGGLRMVDSVLHGEFGTALGYNAAAIGFLLAVVVAWSVWVVRSIRARTTVRLQWPTWLAWTAAVTVGLWWVLRNLPFEPFEALRA